VLLSALRIQINDCGLYEKISGGKGQKSKDMIEQIWRIVKFVPQQPDDRNILGGRILNSQGMGMPWLPLRTEPGYGDALATVSHRVLTSRTTKRASIKARPQPE
jgi:hypothetical protein